MGRVIDAAALLDRLQRGDVIACLDVFDPEPLPLDSPLVDLPNVFCTPHIAGVTEESRRRFFSLMVDECLRHFDGLEPLYELTPQVVARDAGLRIPAPAVPPRTSSGPEIVLGARTDSATARPRATAGTS